MLRRSLFSIKSTATYLKPFQTRHFGVRHKVVELEDAVSIVKNGDTIAISVFVAQSPPEALLRALGDRFKESKEPEGLRILFGGGPGDWATRGLNHFAKDGMVDTAIGGHFGQVPQLAKMVLDNKCAGYAIPMGAVSRLIRATAGKTPGHITKVGLSTFVDPLNSGGALNEKARQHPIVERIVLDGQDYLRYMPFPINVALIRATTADAEGNLSLEHESILGDVKILAMAARSSGGVVIAQVQRLAQTGSIPSRNVSIPGTFVDCVVVADREDEHHLSYFTKENAVWTGEIREPSDNIQTMAMSPRKVIARRASMELQADDVVNLGIGMPEGVASVASEEGIFQYITLTTEAGTIGGVGAGGHDFGPANNPHAFNEMNQQFDLYNGGGLSVAFLGLAECGGKGDVNVSRLSADSLTGPGGFIDIASCTQRINFVGTFAKKGCEMAIEEDPATNKKNMVVKKEGKIMSFIDKVREVTFSSKEAIESGQQVLYITERAVFQLQPNGLELIEIAPGIDLEKDILAHMTVKPTYKLPIKEMDQRIFQDKSMNLYSDMFDMLKQLDTRVTYDAASNVVFLNLQNFVVVSEDEINDLENVLAGKFETYMKVNGGKKCNMVVNYDGFDCKTQLTSKWTEMAQGLQMKYYADVTRYSGNVFMRKKISTELRCESDDEYWLETSDGKEVLTAADLVRLMKTKLHVPQSKELIDYLMGGNVEIDRKAFSGLLKRLRDYRSTKRIPKV